MKKYNNLKQIREIYGATQEQIAEAISVNRVTVANWESGNSVASGSNREKLSIYYGIGPEFFYDKELTEDAKEYLSTVNGDIQSYVLNKKESNVAQTKSYLSF